MRLLGKLLKSIRQKLELKNISNKRIFGVVESYSDINYSYLLLGEDGNKYFFSRNLVGHDKTDVFLSCLLNKGVKVSFNATKNNIAYNLEVDKEKYKIVKGIIDYVLFNESELDYDCGVIATINNQRKHLKFNLDLVSPSGERVNKVKPDGSVDILYDSVNEKLMSVYIEVD